MIRTDAHMHSFFSSDSQSAPEEMVKGALAKGLTAICFTDHYDKDNTDWGAEDVFVPEKYFKKMLPLKEKYRGMIDIRVGVEIGMQPYLGEYYKDFVNKYPFDFVIGSVHSAERTDIATKKLFHTRTPQEVYRIVLEETLEDIRVTSDFDVLGHLDYVVRYSDRGAYSYKKFSDEIDAVLRALIERGKGLELNTSGLKYGLGFAHPHMEVMKRYRELGGEIVTVGADGHCPEHIAYDFKKAEEILRECGFAYYTEFVERKPSFCIIS